jgi:hypothetical protein
MTIAVVVSYPSTDPKTGEPLKFDMDYYKAKHMPLIDKVRLPRCLNPFMLCQLFWSAARVPDGCCCVPSPLSVSSDEI